MTKENEVELFIHCKTCFDEKPHHLSAREHMRLECGWTKQGLQVWCVRCEKNVVHLDFMGQKVDIR